MNQQHHRINVVIGNMNKLHYNYSRCIFINEDVYCDKSLMRRIKEAVYSNGLRPLLMDPMNNTNINTNNINTNSGNIKDD